MDSLAEISDHMAIRDLMLKYAAGVDDRDRELYGSCFAEDVEILGFGSGTVNGRAAWLDYVFGALEKYSASQHMLGPPWIRLDGDRARARTDVQALHFFKQGFEIDDAETFTLWATYETEMHRIDGEWKIAKHRLVSRGTRLA